MKSEKKFVEVLSEVIKQLIGPSHDDLKTVETHIVENLTKKGYELDEISEMLDEIFESMNITRARDFKMRMIHPLEIKNLTPEARKYLFDLRSSEVIDDEKFEELLNETIAVDFKVGINSLKTLLSRKGIIVNKIIN